VSDQPSSLSGKSNNLIGHGQNQATGVTTLLENEGLRRIDEEELYVIPEYFSQNSFLK
jgi:hypothetical protein